MKIIFLLYFLSLSFSQSWFNHPELEWKTLESEHFKVHFHNGTERTAEEVIRIAEFVYTPVTDMYKYYPKEKTDIVIKDTDDFSNGSAYFFNNKIEIWANPLDFDLRGAHRWIQNVITHEFVHIIQIGKSLKYNRHFPAFYFQTMEYEDEKKDDVLYGYPNSIISYAIPSVSVPSWFAEGVAQVMYNGANFDYWDTHREMVLRDAFLNGSVLTINEMNSFGKTGVGNEQIYIQGFSLAGYIADNLGADKFRTISEEISKPYQYSFAAAVENATGEKLDDIYDDWYQENLKKYTVKHESIGSSRNEGKILIDSGTTNLHPVWSPDGEKFAYLSNKGKDYFGQTDLYVYDFIDSSDKKVIGGIFSAPVWVNDSTLIFSKKSKPNKHGSKYYDLYLHELKKKKKKKEPKRLTHGLRLTSPSIDHANNLIAAIGIEDGTSNIFVASLDFLEDLSFKKITNFEEGEKIFSLSFHDKKIFFDIVENHTRDIYVCNIDSGDLRSIQKNNWDDRDPFYHDGKRLFSSDRSGIFNIYQQSEYGSIASFSNALGGALMPSISKDGKLLFSLYQNGRYNISIIEKPLDLNINLSGNYRDYIKKSSDSIPLPIYNEKKYKDNMSLPFIFPRLFIDYKTIKPGLYFYTNDVLDKYFLFGGASMNNLKDLDLFLLFELRKYKPTLYTNLYWVTRNVDREQYYVSITGDIYDNFKFESTDTYIMFSADIGSKIALKANKFTMNYNYSKYSVHSIGYTRLYHNNELQSSSPFDITYDYYRGHKMTLGYNFKSYYPQYISNMVPQNGYEINADISFEKNDFDPEFKISEEFGTLSLEFTPHNTERVNFELKKNISLIKKRRMAFSQSIKVGYLTNKSIDDFFYYFGGGLTGIKGYTFYDEGLSGTQLFLSSSSIRLPLFMEKNYKLFHLLIQNLSLNYIVQMGTVSLDDIKYSNGVELRVNGSSFYAFPFALSYEYHIPLKDSMQTTPKHYIKLLFDFMD